MCWLLGVYFYCFVFKQKTAYDMRISDWSSDVCLSVLIRNASPPQNGDEPIRGPCPFGRGVDPDKRLQRYTRFRSIGQPSTEIVPVAAHRQRGNADRAAKIEREYLRSLIATKLERHEGQKHRLAGAGWTHNR